MRSTAAESKKYTETGERSQLRDKLGVCQWFHYEAYEDLSRAVDDLRELGVRHLRTGVSWADFHRPGGKDWYDHQMEALREFEVLLSVWHTPPSISEGGTCASPPQRLEDYAGFIGDLIDDYGDCFATLELWNEPNNLYKWDFRSFDPDWSKFAAMVAGAGEVARAAGKPTVLGGMMPVDHDWLELMSAHGAAGAVDVIGIHSFPHMWWSGHPNWDWYRHWHGWAEKLEYISSHAEGKPVWVTETGLATWDLDQARPARFGLQCERLRKVAAAPAERLYWYSLIDLDDRRDAIEGFHVDENEYHLGLSAYDGEKKPAWHLFRDLLQS